MKAPIFHELRISNAILEQSLIFFVARDVSPIRECQFRIQVILEIQHNLGALLLDWTLGDLKVVGVEHVAVFFFLDGVQVLVEVSLIDDLGLTHLADARRQRFLFDECVPRLLQGVFLGDLSNLLVDALTHVVGDTGTFILGNIFLVTRTFQSNIDSRICLKRTASAVHTHFSLFHKIIILNYAKLLNK